MVGGWNKDTNLAQLRGMVAKILEAKLAVKPDPSTVSHVENDECIIVRDGASVAVRIYKPKNVPKDGCPVLVAFHGGGFVIGNLEGEGPLCQLFTTLGGIAVNVDYRLAPEHPFPIPIHDAFDAVKWVCNLNPYTQTCETEILQTVQNARHLGINLSKGFLVGGESAGADLALGVSHLWVNEKQSPPLSGIFSSISGAVSEETVPERYRDRILSLEQNAKAPVVTKETLDFIKDKYKPDPTSPLAYPIVSPDLTGFPKTYFQACGLDPVRDCTIIMEQVWKDAGTATKLDIYPGLPHGFWSLYPQAEFSKKHQRDTKAGLQWLLDRGFEHA
ncbi:AB hydrolase superfamily protein [Colletotrichum spaethianum]|uniref:AB hydrolase superfamily protein n=1 Tax=Colletotrichum spaethianum TaxID=700344 RepID=A0AA37UN99_9PEZI|nr:AB hydrolase superfamily protein [Colletotrichum spaethianum]GKT48090.1 AB hydrolase superfamily protein [Colletotrichum spaethianum]